MIDRTPSTAPTHSEADPGTDGTACDFTAVTTHPETAETRGEFDPATNRASLAVPELVGRLKEADPCDLPAVYDSVDPDALDELFADERRAVSNLFVTFDYAGYSVKVSDGALSVTPVE